MRELPLAQGLVLKSDGAPESEVQASSDSRSLLVLAVPFITLFALMQFGWSTARSTWVEQLVIDKMTVKPAAWLIAQITPKMHVHAIGSHLNAPGGGINILNGCDGMEVIFLLVAAMLMAPIPVQWRLWGALAGSVLIYVCNQVRILALFYSYRLDRPLFDLLHGMVTPVLLVLVATSFYVVWLGRCRTERVSGQMT
jgi:exosortase/archaeosortase family protein